MENFSSPSESVHLPLSLLKKYNNVLLLIMDRAEVAKWRKAHGMTRRELAGRLGVHHMAVAYWEWGHRRIPALLPLALEALENRIRKEQENGIAGGVPGVQKAE
jgi:DNA-binding transcriptional regulator YiaG